MLVKFSTRFLTQLQIIVDFIAKDSFAKACSFQQTLFSEFKKLDFMPYKFRKSIYFDDENIRDFIFKGYVVPYFVDMQGKIILILAICKENLLKD